MELFENTAPVARELSPSEYFDLWWQSITQNPMSSITAGGILVVLLTVFIVLWFRLASKTPPIP